MRSSTVRWFGFTVLVAGAAVVGCGGDDGDAAGASADAGGVAEDSGGSVSPGLDAGTSADATVEGGAFLDSGRDAALGADGSADSGGPNDAESDPASDASDAADAGLADATGAADAADADAADADAADAADASSAPRPGRSGTLLFSQDQEGAFVGKGAAAYFAQDGTYDDAGHAGTPECVQQPIGASCFYRVCAPLAADGGAPPAPSQAGAVTVRGGSGFPAGDIVLTPNVADSYAVTAPPTFDATTVYVRAGDVLTYSAAGAAGAVGPFSVDVLAPADVAVTAPPIVVDRSNANTTSVARASDLTVAWSGGEVGSSVRVTLSTGSEATDTVKYVVCTFPAGPGVGTVPSLGGLANLDVTNGTTVTGSFDLTPQTSATTTAGNAGGSRSAVDAWTITATAAGTPQTSHLTTM